MTRALLLLAFAACDPDEPVPPPAPTPPVQHRAPAPRTITYAPETVGADAPPTTPIELAAPGELPPDRGLVVAGELTETCAPCDGAYDYTFTSLACTRGACTLGFTARVRATSATVRDTLRFDYFAGGPASKLRRAVVDAIRAWERRRGR